ncbi:MAG: hypothetical protein AAGD25_28315 [Cyanobacteria bacterium P01_F01_bin.150]
MEHNTLALTSPMAPLIGSSPVNIPDSDISFVFVEGDAPSTSDFGFVNLRTGQYTELDGPLSGMTDIAQSPIDGRFFAVTESFFGNLLYSFELGSDGKITNLTEIGPVGPRQPALGFAEDGTLYGAGFGQIYEIDLQTGQATSAFGVIDRFVPTNSDLVVVDETIYVAAGFTSDDPFEYIFRFNRNTGVFIDPPISKPYIIYSLCLTHLLLVRA